MHPRTAVQSCPGIAERTHEFTVLCPLNSECLLWTVVKRFGTVEHVCHGRDLSDVPGCDIPVKRSGTYEHAVHVRDLSDVPGSNGPVKLCGVLEQNVHGRDIFDVPVLRFACKCGRIIMFTLNTCTEININPVVLYFGAFKSKYCASERRFVQNIRTTI